MSYYSAPGFGIALVAFGAYVLVDNLVHPANIEAIKQKAKEETEGRGLVDTIRAAATGESLSEDDQKRSKLRSERF